MLTEVVTGVTVWRVLGVGGEGLEEGRLDVDQLGADDGGAELGVGSLSFRLGPSCLICLRLRPVARNWVGSDQHCPLSLSHDSDRLSSQC